MTDHEPVERVDTRQAVLSTNCVLKPTVLTNDSSDVMFPTCGLQNKKWFSHLSLNVNEPFCSIVLKNRPTNIHVGECRDLPFSSSTFHSFLNIPSLKSPQGLLSLKWRKQDQMILSTLSMQLNLPLNLWERVILPGNPNLNHLLVNEVNVTWYESLALRDQEYYFNLIFIWKRV